MYACQLRAKDARWCSFFFSSGLGCARLVRHPAKRRRTHPRTACFSHCLCSQSQFRFWLRHMGELVVICDVTDFQRLVSSSDACSTSALAHVPSWHWLIRQLTKALVEIVGNKK